MSDYLWKSPAWFNELIFKVYTCLINDPKIQHIVPVHYGRNSTICVFSYHDTTKLYASKKN